MRHERAAMRAGGGPATAAALGLILGSALALAAAGTAFGGEDPKAAAEGALRNSVVKVSATLRGPDPLHPWSKQGPREASGTGVVIEGKRILTNAHVVTFASQLFVESDQSSDKHTATVEFVSPGIDLAVLRLDDEAFFDDRPPLPRTKDLPAVKDSVLVYGYPQGGSSLSVTKGIVSRTEFAPYGDMVSGLRVQVDAAINPGNSGGPALIDGKVVGLIFSKLTQSDNIGYIIPGEEIELFLADVKDGKFDGKPAMYDRLQTLENDALRGFLRLDRKAAGMVVHEPDRADEAYPLKRWDVITKVGGHDVDATGMSRVNGDLRLRFQYFVQSAARDGKVPMTVIRKGEPVDIELPVAADHPMLIEPLRGHYPSYFLYGPLAFSPVTAEFTNALGGGGGDRLFGVFSLIGSPLATRRGDRPAFPGEELVMVASTMFDHKIARGYDNPFAKVVKEVNGVKVRDFRHFVTLLRDTKDQYTRISFDDRGSETIVFDHKEALAATEDVLNNNGIRQRASDDMLAVWNAKPADPAPAEKPAEKAAGNPQ